EIERLNFAHDKAVAESTRRLATLQAESARERAGVQHQLEAAELERDRLSDARTDLQHRLEERDTELAAARRAVETASQDARRRQEEIVRLSHELDWAHERESEGCERQGALIGRIEALEMEAQHQYQNAAAERRESQARLDAQHEVNEALRDRSR